MSGQIVNISWKAAVSETALKCGDPFFKDFPKHIYSQAIYRAERGIAKEFGIMDRIWEYTNVAGDSEIDIGPLNFTGAWEVTVLSADADDDVVEDNEEPVAGTLTTDSIEVNADGSYSYSRVQWEEMNTTGVAYKYAINYIGNRYVFKYSDAEEDDVIKIYYVSSIAGEEDYEYYDSEGEANLIPVLPNRYYEETVRRASIYIAQLGIAKYDGDKSNRFGRILQMYRQSGDVSPEKGLHRDRPWIMTKMFSTQYP